MDFKGFVKMYLIPLNILVYVPLKHYERVKKECNFHQGRTELRDFTQAVLLECVYTITEYSEFLTRAC